MKTGAVFVLVAFITVGMELACAWRPPFRGEGAEGIPPGSRDDTQPRFRLRDGLAQQQAVCLLENGDLAFISPVSFDLQEQTPCISHSSYHIGLGLIRSGALLSRWKMCPGWGLQ